MHAKRALVVAPVLALGLVELPLEVLHDAVLAHHRCLHSSVTVSALHQLHLDGDVVGLRAVVARHGSVRRLAPALRLVADGVREHTHVRPGLAEGNGVRVAVPVARPVLDRQVVATLPELGQRRGKRARAPHLLREAAAIGDVLGQERRISRARALATLLALGEQPVALLRLTVIARKPFRAVADAHHLLVPLRIHGILLGVAVRLLEKVPEHLDLRGRPRAVRLVARRLTHKDALVPIALANAHAVDHARHARGDRGLALAVVGYARSRGSPTLSRFHLRIAGRGRGRAHAAAAF